MRLTVYAVGKLKKGPETALVDLYRGRIDQLVRRCGITAFSIEEVSESQLAVEAQRKAHEAERLLSRISNSDRVFALDEGGDDVSSRKLAQVISSCVDQGHDAAFVIGGAGGLGDSLRARANNTIAFGRQTWPHRLVRIMLCEQLYRSLTIMLNHPYHRD